MTIIDRKRAEELRRLTGFSQALGIIDELHTEQNRRVKTGCDKGVAEHFEHLESMLQSLKLIDYYSRSVHPYSFVNDSGDFEVTNLEQLRKMEKPEKTHIRADNKGLVVPLINLDDEAMKRSFGHALQLRSVNENQEAYEFFLSALMNLSKGSQIRQIASLHNRSLN